MKLIEAGIAETPKHSRERRSWANSKRGLCVPTPGQWPAGSRALGEWAEEPRSRWKGALLGQAGLTDILYSSFANTSEKKFLKKDFKMRKLWKSREKPFGNEGGGTRAQRAH